MKCIEMDGHGVLRVLILRCGLRSGGVGIVRRVGLGLTHAEIVAALQPVSSLGSLSSPRVHGDEEDDDEAEDCRNATAQERHVRGG
jgi:hypothetical protein